MERVYKAGSLFRVYLVNLLFVGVFAAVRRGFDVFCCSYWVTFTHGWKELEPYKTDVDRAVLLIAIRFCAKDELKSISL